MTISKKKTSSAGEANLLSFFPRQSPSLDKLSSETPRSNNSLGSAKRHKRLEKFKPLLCTSDQACDVVLLGPQGIQELDNPCERTCASPSVMLTEEDYFYGPLCGAKKTFTKRKRRVGSSVNHRASGARRNKKHDPPLTPTLSSVSPSPLPPTSTFSKAFPCELTQQELRDSIMSTGKKFFGVDHLMDFQMASIEAIFRQKDVFVVMSTGAGKSLCYQLPSMMPESRGCFVLVVSPLIALMEDQVLSLHQKKIPSMTFSGASAQAWTLIKNGNYRIVYSSPEYILLHLERILSNFSDQILFIAIDECHCVSEWGHHFRPSYRGLAKLRTRLSHVPLMCLTATATQEVCLDIVRTFKLRPLTTLHLKGSTNRSNIFYRVQQRTGSIFDDLKRLLALNPNGEVRKPVDNSTLGPYSSTLIYVSTKQDAEALAKTLKKMGVLADSYHAGMSTAERSRVHHSFLADNLQVVCATIAFGMGIDKPDIRRIIHWCLPSSLESYAQQSGRAGRDRILSEALILWSPKDVSKTRQIILKPSEAVRLSERYKQHLLILFDAVLGFVESESRCRREVLLNYFGETVVTDVCSKVVTPGVCNLVSSDGSSPRVQCDRCDICCQSPTNKSKSSLVLDLTNEAQTLMKCILACKERTGAILPCKLAVGSQSREVLTRQLNKTSVFSQGSHMPFSWWKNFISFMRIKGYVEEKLVQGLGRGKRQNHYMAVKLTPLGRQLMNSQDRFIVQDPPTYLINKKHSTPQTPGSSSLTASPTTPSESLQNHEAQLREELLKIRLQEARQKQCAPYMILPMISIEYMVHLRPTSCDHLFRFIPHVSSLCSVLFLNKLFDAITHWASRYSYPVNLETIDSSMLTQFFYKDVKEEVIPNVDECITLSPGDVKYSSSESSLANGYVTPPPIFPTKRNEHEPTFQSSSPVYELSQSDIAEFDNLLPYTKKISP